MECKPTIHPNYYHFIIRCRNYVFIISYRRQTRAQRIFWSLELNFEWKVIFAYSKFEETNFHLFALLFPQ